MNLDEWPLVFFFLANLGNLTLYPNSPFKIWWVILNSPNSHGATKHCSSERSNTPKVKHVTPQKTNMTMFKLHHLKMYFLLNMGDFPASHVSFQGRKPFSPGDRAVLQSFSSLTDRSESIKSDHLQGSPSDLGHPPGRSVEEKTLTATHWHSQFFLMVSDTQNEAFFERKSMYCKILGVYTHSRPLKTWNLE